MLRKLSKPKDGVVGNGMWGRELDFYILVGIFRSGYSAWGHTFQELSLAILLFENSFSDHSLENFRSDMSLENLVTKSFAIKHSLRNFNCGSFVWRLSPVLFRLIHSVRDISLRSVCL